ncbi:MAG: enoyl-CoA hydratase/isomerase family protein [Chloroflexota bacterium]|nr:MAG: enoyl-CoA hydratase/isomerase family protein [Chloroflexota bacterium]
MKFETIIYEKKDKVAWITLNRPEKYNAQNQTLRSEVITALEDAKDDDEVWVIVLTGAGDKAFSSGADVGGFGDRTTISVITSNKGAKRPYNFIREIPKPVIAMVNGLALGGGCELAMSCDMIIASEKARFGQPEISVGVIPGGAGTQILPRLVGEKKAREMIFTGDPISADEALRIGLVNKVVPPDKLREAVEEMINKLKSKSPAIMKFAKLAVNKSLETPLSVGIECEADLFAMCFGTQDQKEGAKAFMEKRPPNYTGK